MLGTEAYQHIYDNVFDAIYGMKRGEGCDCYATIRMTSTVIEAVNTALKESGCPTLPEITQKWQAPKATTLDTSDTTQEGSTTQSAEPSSSSTG